MANIAGLIAVNGLASPSDVSTQINTLEPNYLGYPSGVFPLVPVDLTGGFSYQEQCTITLGSTLEGGVALGHALNAIPYVLGGYYSTIRSSDYLNYYARFARFFGMSAWQSATHLYINKADLPLLTPLANNKAEALLVALLMQVMQYESNSLISGIVIEHWRTQFNQTIQNASTIYFTLLLNLYIPVRRIEDEIQDIMLPIMPNAFT